LKAKVNKALYAGLDLSLGRLIPASTISRSFLMAARCGVVEFRKDTTAERLSSALGQWMGRGRETKDLLGGMLSLEEIKKWADTIEAQSTSNLIKFCHKPARPAHRAVIEIVFADGVNEYQIWIFREFNIIYVDAFHEGIESDSKLFRGPLARHSLESISRILRRSQPWP
jgi:hypothetical protein